MYANGNGINVS